MKHQLKEILKKDYRNYRSAVTLNKTKLAWNCGNSVQDKVEKYPFTGAKFRPLLFRKKQR